MPNTEKYQRFITLIRNIIKTDEKPPTSAFNKAVSIGIILKDLIQTYELESINDFYIDLHPKVKEHSLKLFKDGHYAQAIFESVKALDNFVRSKANIPNEYSSKAMAKAFDENNPIIKLNDLSTISDKDEQKGFKLLFMGAITGIRNPKARDTIKQKDKNRTLEYLAFISLLFRRAEEGKL